MGMGALMVLALAAPAGLRAEADATNAVTNGGFESGKANWSCWPCQLTFGSPAQSGAAAQMVTTKTTSRSQLLQKNISLQPNTTYELKFWARSANGANLQVSLQKQVSPYTNYGFSPKTFDVTPTGQEFSYTFTTSGFSQPVNNARLRFRADKGKGLAYSIDNVSLTVVGSGPSPTPLPPPSPPPPPPTGEGKEMLIYDWNKPMTLKERGFGMDRTSQTLSQNWEKPVNYADGRVYFRVRINGIPQNQPGMNLGFCFWQPPRENCKGNDVPGVPGSVVTWDFRLDEMWKRSGVEVDWATPRLKQGLTVRDAQKDPVSNWTSDNWGGNDPDDWYPLDLRFQVVLVPAGATFSGWQNYP
jgi:hypothetical protein